MLLLRRLLACLTILLSLCSLLPSHHAWAQPVAQLAMIPTAAPLACEEGTQSSGATYRICMPDSPTIWNGKLMVYAHGYVAPNLPVGIPEDQMTLPGGQGRIDALITTQGYAFATSGYSVNGLAVTQGVADLVDVVQIFAEKKGAAQKVMLIGVSEGGLIAALALERHAAVFNGGLAMCGPYGSFVGQTDYFGDFRVVFDYFFPGLIPGSAIDVPATLLDSWESSYYSQTVKPVISDPANAAKVDQLLAATSAAVNASDAASKEQTINQLLWYNIYATNDAQSKLGGQPFDNQNRIYSGTLDDVALNAGVQRFTADATARAAIATSYETSGTLTVPLLTLHTTLDPVVPYWHSTSYRGKTIGADNMALHEATTVAAYGHCQFSQLELLGAFARLISITDNPPAYQPVQRVYLPAVANQ